MSRKVFHAAERNPSGLPVSAQRGAQGVCKPRCLREAPAPLSFTTLLVLLPPPRCCFPRWRGEELSTAHGQGDAAEQLCSLYLPFQASSTAPQPHIKSQHTEQLCLPPKLTCPKHRSVNYKRSPAAGRSLL